MPRMPDAGLPLPLFQSPCGGFGFCSTWGVSAGGAILEWLVLDIPHVVLQLGVQVLHSHVVRYLYEAFHPSRSFSNEGPPFTKTSANIKREIIVGKDFAVGSMLS